MARPLRVVLGEWQKDDAFRRAITTPVEFVVAPTLRDEDVAPLLHGADVLLSKAFTPGMTAAADSLRLIHTRRSRHELDRIRRDPEPRRGLQCLRARDLDHRVRLHGDPCPQPRPAEHGRAVSGR